MKLVHRAGALLWTVAMASDNEGHVRSGHAIIDDEVTHMAKMVSCMM